MQATNFCQIIRLHLLNAPATSDELALILECSTQQVSRAVSRMIRYRQIKVVGRIPRARRPANLLELTIAGRYITRGKLTSLAENKPGPPHPLEPASKFHQTTIVKS